MGLIDDYFEIYKEKIEEYGDKTVICYQNGAFYEIYEKDENYKDSEKIGNAKLISTVLNNMKYTGKNYGKNTYINFIGFNTSCLYKFLPLLLNANYTVVIVNELESSSEKKLNKTSGNLKRGIVNIYSPSLQPLDFDTNYNLVGLLIKVNNTGKKLVFNTSICSINNNTNDIEMTEEIFKNDLDLSLDELYRILYRYNPKELQVNIIYNNNANDIKMTDKIHNYLQNYFENVKITIVDKKADKYKNYTTINFQNEYFKNVYKNYIMGLLTPLEYLKLDNLDTDTIINLMYTIDYIGKHSLTYISNLNLPKIINECNYLILELNTINQLNIINNSKKGSLFDIIDFTCTTIGKRYLKQLLCKPLKNVNEINNRYLLTKEYSCIKESKGILSKITDFERQHRKMSLGELHPNEFVSLNKNYIEIQQIFDLIINNKDTIYFKQLIEKFFDNKSLVDFNNYIVDYNKIFNFNVMKNITFNTPRDSIVNYFNNGIIKELDDIQDKILGYEQDRENLRLYYDKLITSSDVSFIKLEYTERDGYSFCCTKLRYSCLLKQLSDKEKKEIKTRNISGSVKFYTDKLSKLSMLILTNRNLLNDKIKLNYLQKISEYYIKHNVIFGKLKEFIEILDVVCSNYHCSQHYNYSCPKIVNGNGNSSFFNCTGIRHPIVESLGISFIQNDIVLDNDSLGVLLYGINSAGKSTLLRAIGVNVLMAQAGLYVPCESLVYYPFDTIISQVDLNDDIYKSKSSFINEMISLKKMLSISGPNTLILADELCKGSEMYSATSIVASTILHLIQNNTKFFFTTHLHSLIDTEISNLMKLQIFHLSVSTRNDNIIFNRKLSQGSGSPLYGIEVAKTILDNLEFIDKAFEIRNKLNNEKIDIVSIKKSKYNSKKIMNNCQICESTENLECDHIIEQATANEKGFLATGTHKNHLGNLCTLCKKCHLEKTLGRIKIYGYKDSINGKFLDWEIVKTTF